MKYKKKLFMIVVFFILAISIFKHTETTLKTPTQMLNSEQEDAVNVILKNSTQNDYVVSDEEILSAISGRLPPPELSDLSYVRISSGNLSPNRFANLINIYKPKLIISWNGRLKSLKNFNSVLGNYKKLITINKSRDIFILNH